MSFEMVQRFRYIFDIYLLFFALLTNGYGLLIDIKWSREKGTNRDATLAKRIYITTITLSIALFTIPRLM